MSPGTRLPVVKKSRNGGCLLAHYKGQIPPKDLRDIMDVVTFNHKLICDEWRKRFQGDISFCK